MAIEFKKLSDVEQIEAASDNATVIVEDGGDIKRIAKRNLGGVTSWNDLTDKPFYAETKVVEILPEQSISASGSGNNFYSYMGFETNSIEDLYDKPGSVFVKINGVKYETAFTMSERGRPVLGSFTGSFDDYPYVVEWTDPTHADIGWSLDYGETITIAIYKEQEVVKKLDPKFVGGATAYVNANGEKKILYKDKNCTELLTVAELKKMGVNIVVYDATYTEQTYIAVNVTVYSDYGSITIIQDNGVIVTYYTNEYYANMPA